MMALSLKDGSVLWRYDEAEGVVVDVAGYTYDGCMVYTARNDKGEYVRYLLDGRSGEIKGTLDKTGEKVDGPNSYRVKDKEGRTVSYDRWGVFPEEGMKGRYIFGSDHSGEIVSMGADGVVWRYKICNTRVNNPVQVSETDYIVTDADGNVRRLSVKM